MTTHIDAYWLTKAIEVSRNCPLSSTAFSVGAVIVSPESRELATGYSREIGSQHAEETALQKITDRAALDGATIYSSLEPCSSRSSGPVPCAKLIIDSGIRRVVFAYREPSVFVIGQGAELLEAHDIVVVELPELAEEVKAINRHLV
ncbi:dCMP deaminase [Pseudonocardiaceae bacterium YIM PH 21723]|nr:dCMP deaminase [Pseudonocardiaceae bacterium YIM PH 21723]